METHLFSIDKRGGIDNAYENLFISNNLGDSPEILV